VHERQEATASDFQEQRAQLRNEMVAERQSQFFAAYMENAKIRMNIEIRPDVFEQAAV
jgi:hypothetical protein